MGAGERSPRGRLGAAQRRSKENSWYQRARGIWRPAFSHAGFMPCAVWWECPLFPGPQWFSDDCYVYKMLGMCQLFLWECAHSRGKVSKPYWSCMKRDHTRGCGMQVPSSFAASSPWIHTTLRRSFGIYKLGLGVEPLLSWKVRKTPDNSRVMITLI